MKHMRTFLISFAIATSFVLTALISPTFASSMTQARSNVPLSGRWCVGSGCNGYLEDYEQPFCSVGQQEFKADNVYDTSGKLVGVLYIFVSYSDQGPSQYNSDCASFWGGFRASVNGLDSVVGAAGIYNTQYEQGPISNLNNGQWASSYMYTFLQNPRCQSAWISGYNSSDGATFNHKAIAGGSGC